MSERSIAIADDVREMLKQSSELLNEVRWGINGYMDRLDEMSGNYPGGAGTNGGRVKGSYSNPTASAADKRDPGASAMSGFRKDVKKLWLATQTVHAYWNDGRYPKQAPAKMEDPGCEPCASIADKLRRLKDKAPAEPDEFANHWCPTYCSVDDTTKANAKGEHPRVAVCYWCYRFSLPKEKGGAARLPSVYELVAHAQGRRVMRSA